MGRQENVWVFRTRAITNASLIRMKISKSLSKHCSTTKRQQIMRKDQFNFSFNNDIWIKISLSDFKTHKHKNYDWMAAIISI